MKHLLAAVLLCIAAESASAARKPRRGMPQTEAPAAVSVAPQAQESAPLSLGMSGRTAKVLDAPASGSLKDLGLENGDELCYLGATPVHSEQDAAKALYGWKSAERLWAAVVRGGRAVALQTGFVSPERVPGRDLTVLTPKEEAAREAYVEGASPAKPLSALTYPSLTLPADERLWIRFPKGLPANLNPGDVVEAETSAPLAADRKLDFLAISPGSKVWLEAVSAREDGPAQALRLHAYKIALVGGRTYPISALPAASAGSGAFVRVTPGGTIVTAPGSESRTALKPEWNIQLRLLEPLSLAEPQEYYRAGPGLWVKEIREAGARALEVTMVVPGRSADRAGLKPGDRVYSIESNAAARLDFSAALSALYGAFGTECELRVTRRGGPRSETLRLKRGVAWKRGFGLRLRRDGESVLIAEVSEGSPAAKAGVRVGMTLKSLSGSPVQGLDRAAMRSLLDSDGENKVGFVFADPDGRDKSYSLAKDWYASSLSPELSKTPYTPARH